MEIINIFLVIVSLLTAGLSLLIILGKNTSHNRIFSFFLLSIGLWSFGVLFFRITPSLDNALNVENINYIIAAIIPAFFLHFSYLFPTDQKISKYKKYSIYIPLLIITLGLLIEPHLILKSVGILKDNEKTAIVNLPYYLIYTIYFISYVIIAYINLIRSFLSTQSKEIKIQLEFIFIGTIIPYMLATFFDLILPPFDYSYIWIGPLLGFVVACVLVYAIYKHHFLNAKIITSEFFTISLWIFILIRILIAKSSEDITMDIVLLILTIIFGILLIKSILLENKQKEELKILNLHLAEKVAEQTQAVKDAYELEKKARRELEKLNETKDQFIMITQHNLRTPVTSIKWELESMLSGSHGEISEDIRKTLLDTQTSTNHLAHIVDDFLNITALKVGSQILNLESTNIKTLFEDVLTELRIDIRQMHIGINFPTDAVSWPVIKIDRNKIREVLLIIIENAVRYNIENGKITIRNKVENNMFEMKIENTGVGISNEDHRNIFNRLFYRGKRAQITHPVGMGIGLSVARAIARAHHGDISISSAGENMGAEVTLTLPINFLEKIEIENN